MAMVYYALVSLVPLLLLLLATLGLLLRVSEMAAATEQQVLRTIETSIGPGTADTIGALLVRLQEGSVVAMGAGVVGLLITGSALFRHLRLGFRALWKHDPPLAAGSVRGAVRDTLIEHATAFLMLLTAGVMLALTLGLIAVVHWLSARFDGLPRFTDTAGWLLALPVSLGLATLTFALLFKYLPPVPLRWRQVGLASVLCGIAWVVGADLMALYASFGDRNPYGAIGGLFVVMLWMNFVSQVLFLGGVLCKVVATTQATSATIRPFRMADTSDA